MQKSKASFDDSYALWFDANEPMSLFPSSTKKKSKKKNAKSASNDDEEIGDNELAQLAKKYTEDSDFQLLSHLIPGYQGFDDIKS